jgi:hypothetical protein
MTIAELIDLLQSCDPSTRVVVSGIETGLNSIGSIESVELGPNSQRGRFHGEFDARAGGKPAVYLKAKVA